MYASIYVVQINGGEMLFCSHLPTFLPSWHISVDSDADIYQQVVGCRFGLQFLLIEVFEWTSLIGKFSKLPGMNGIGYSRSNFGLQYTTRICFFNIFHNIWLLHLLGHIAGCKWCHYNFCPKHWFAEQATVSDVNWLEFHCEVFMCHLYPDILNCLAHSKKNVQFFLKCELSSTYQHET